MLQTVGATCRISYSSDMFLLRGMGNIQIRNLLLNPSGIDETAYGTDYGLGPCLLFKLNLGFISDFIPFSEDTLVTMEEEPVSKVTFSENVDFKFTVAYEAFSKLYDAVNNPENKRKLNDIITELFNKEISYPRFYNDINQFKGEPSSREFRRVRIKGQRKRAYRRDQQEKDRIKRHRR